MRFGVLGRLEAFRSDGTPVPVAGPARRQVLAALLARAGSWVSASTLVDDLWGLAPPRSAMGNLRSHVARLRDDLGRDEDVLVTEGDGYRLRIAPDELDANCFETLLAEAGGRTDAAAAVDRLDAALALWRDEAYLEFGDAPFAVAERVRLAELRTQARERRTDLALDLGCAAELISELEHRVRSQPYRERGWEQLALALYRGGRQADALHACRRARAVLLEDLGIDPGPALQELEGRILRQDPDLRATSPVAAVPDTLRGRCPYRGLARYEEHDAPLFVGRERLTSVLAGQLADHSVVVVTGASGVGKSSLVRAGLLPALRAGAVPGSAAWRIIVRTPTDANLTDDARHLDLMVLDQAEELFTAVDVPTADALLADISHFVTYGDGRVLLVLRSDYFGRLADLAQLAGLAEKATVLVGPMRVDELRRAVVEPAAAAGVQLEPDLIETIMQDVSGQAEPLPLLSEAMVRTWQRREGDLLTLGAYRNSGGVAGAIEAAAEDCYQRLDDGTRQAARHVLVRMAAPSASGGWVRRPLPLDEIATDAGARVVLDAFVASRLAVINDQRVEIAHDALLEHWPRLRDWLDERAIASDLVDHLGRAASAWRASGRQEADLYRGPRLAAALDWRANHPLDVSADEHEFLDASAAAVQTELHAARDQVAREVSGRRRLRRIAVALGAVAVLALAGGLVALREHSSAQQQARNASSAALTADADRIATVASTLPADQRGLGLLLAAQGYQLQVSDVSAGGLQAALMQTPPGLARLYGFAAPSVMPHLDNAARLLAAPGADGIVRVYDIATGRLVHRLTWSTPREFAVFSSDDRLVAAGGSDGNVVVWDLATGRPSGSPVPVGDGIVHPVFDPHDDTRIYTVSTHGAVTAWDRSDPSHPRVVAEFDGLLTESAGTAPALTISADGRRIAAGEVPTGPAAVWDTATHALVRMFSGASIGTFGVGGDTLPFGFGTGTLLVDALSGRAETTVPGTGAAASAILSSDGRRLAVPEDGPGVVAVYDLTSSGRASLAATVPGQHTAPLGFLPDGRLATGDASEAAVWRLGADLPPLGLRLDTIADRRSATSSEDQEPGFLAGQPGVLVNGGVLYDGTSGQPTAPLLGGSVSGVIAASPDGRLLAGATSDGLGIWDVATRSRVALLPDTPASTADTLGALRWSDDGKRIAAEIGGSTPYVWDVTDPRHPSTPQRVGAREAGVVDDVQFVRGGQRLVVLSGGNTRFAAVDVESGRVTWTASIGGEFVREWAVSPDGRSIAIDSGTANAGHVTVLDATSGRITNSLTLPSFGGVGYVNGGRWLVISSNQPDPAAQLYDATTLDSIGVPFPTGDVDQDPLSTDPAGTRFSEWLVYTRNPPLFPDPLVWNVDPTAWVRDACALAGRNLTHREWQKYLPGRPYRLTCPGLPPGD